MEKLRFKDFKFVKNGVLSDICEISTGKFNNEKIGNHNVYGANGIIGKTNKISHVGRNIIVGRVGSAGKSMIVDGKYYVSDNAFILKSLQIDYTYAYIEHLKLEQYSFGSVQKLIKSSDLKKIEINIISNEEKVKIGEYFYNLNFLINNKKRQLELMEKYKEDLLDKIFNQKIRFKDENGCDYPEWEITKLSQISKSNIKNKELPKNFIYVDLTSVKKGTLIEENELNKNNCPDAASYNLEKNDILIARVRPYQQNNYFVKKDLKTKYVASNGFTHLRINKDHNPEFIYHLIHTKENLKYININSTGTTYPTISNKDLLNLKILLPIIEEQEKIANLFSNLDLKINVLKNSIKNLKEFKIDMLEKMF